jgi:hypothetical protein
MDYNQTRGLYHDLVVKLSPQTQVRRKNIDFCTMQTQTELTFKPFQVPHI